MSHLVRGDLFEVVVEGGVVACCREVGLGELLQDITVELVLEMLERQRVVENLPGNGSAWPTWTRRHHSRRRR